MTSERRLRINRLKATLKKMKDEGLEIDLMRLRLICMSLWNVSKRTAKEYIDTARFELE